MRTLQITTSQRTIAYILLASQLFTGCNLHQTINPSKKPEKAIQPEKTSNKDPIVALSAELVEESSEIILSLKEDKKAISIEPTLSSTSYINQEITSSNRLILQAKGGHEVILNERDEQATVQEKVQEPFRREPLTLPIRKSPQINLQLLAQQDKKKQERLVQVVFPEQIRSCKQQVESPVNDSYQQGYVLIAETGGLQGGMKKRDDNGSFKSGKSSRSGNSKNTIIHSDGSRSTITDRELRENWRKGYILKEGRFADDREQEASYGRNGPSHIERSSHIFYDRGSVSSLDKIKGELSEIGRIMYLEEQRDLISKFIHNTLPARLKNTNLSLEELNQLQEEIKYWLQNLDSCEGYYWDEADKELIDINQAKRRLKEKREEVETKQYEAEQEISGKQNAQISAEAGRSIVYTLIPGDTIALPFLAQFTQVYIEIEPSKYITFTGAYERFLKPFKSINISPNNKKVRREIARRTLYADGFIRIIASMQGESSFTIRPTENFTIGLLIHPGQKLRKDLLESFKRIDIISTHDVMISKNPTPEPMANDSEVIYSKGPMKIMARTEEQEICFLRKENFLHFSLQPGDPIPIPFLSLFKNYTIQATHDTPIVSKLEKKTTGFMDITVSKLLSDVLPDRAILQKKIQEYVALFKKDKALQESLKQLAEVNDQLTLKSLFTNLFNFSKSKVEISEKKIKEALQKKPQLEKKVFASPLYQQGIQLGIQAELRRQAEVDEAEWAIISPPHPRGVSFFTNKAIEARDHRKEAQLIQEDCITPLSQLLNQGHSTTWGSLFGGGSSNQDTVEALVDTGKFLGKFSISAPTSLKSWKDVMGIEEKYGQASVLYQKLTDEVKQNWEKPEEYRARMKAARKFQRRVTAYERVFKAPVNTEVLQLVLGEPIIKRTNKEERKGGTSKPQQKNKLKQATDSSIGWREKISAATKWFNFSSGWPSIWGNKTTSDSNSTPTQHTKSKQKEKNALQEKTSQEAKSSSWSWPSMWGQQTASKSDYTSIQHTKSKQKEKSSPQEKIKEKPQSRITLIRDWLRKWRDRNAIFDSEKMSTATQAALKFIVDKDDKDNPPVYDAQGKPTYEARCNKGVNMVYEKLTNNKDLAGKRANQMIAYMAQSPHWEKATSMEQAHHLANEGYFVVAGWTNPLPEKSGHVAVVVPGDMVKSDWWDCFVPLTLDTGARARQAAGLLSQGFGKNKRSEIEFYVYKGPINKK